MFNRFKRILSIFTICFLILILRILYLQVIRGPELSKYAYTQRIQNYKIEKLRGDILDRNDIPFTNRTEKALVVIQPLYLDISDNEVYQICELLGADFEDTRYKLFVKKEPVIIETSEEIGQNIMSYQIEGISTINTLERYGDKTVASHVLGYLNADDDGDSGIEKFYNDILKYDKENIIATITDANRDMVQGLGYRMIRVAPDIKKLSVKLTLDYHIQKITEEVMEQYNTSGAVVILNISDGDIVAMASKEDFDQNGIEKYLNSRGNELFNKAVASYNLGSIFKIIDVAAALENGNNPSQQYYCKGYVDIGEKIFRCSSYNAGGHGFLDLEDAFAHSCNAYFIDLALKVGYEDILSMASAFGFGLEVGIKHQGIAEALGNLPGRGYYSAGDIANLSIGQGEVLATPLQVANLVATIANNGILNTVNIVDSIIDDNDNKIGKIRVNGSKRIISSKTATDIKKFMGAVIEKGTGVNINLEEYGGVAGKTGSAETGQIRNGEKVVHAWFAGYFPVQNPKYAAAVFIENGKYGSQAAAPIFEQIARKILQKGL